MTSITDAASATVEVFVFPASFAQQRLWFLQQLAPENPFYNISAAIRFVGLLNVAALEQALNEIVRRHEILRTNFEMVAGELQQVVSANRLIVLSVVDLQTQPSDEREATAQEWAIAEAQRPFNLITDPLFQAALLQLEIDDHILVLNLHHILADGWSIGVLVRELGVLYPAFCQGHNAPLPELPIQYADFAHWQREWLHGEILETHLRYWRQQLADLPGLNLPTDRSRPAVQTYRGATDDFAFSSHLTLQLERLSQQTGTTLFMTLLAAFQTLLSRYTGQTEIVVGSPISNRNQRELEDLIGFFVNSLVLRTDLSGNPTFRELLTRVREVTLEAYAHQDLPFEKLVQELHPERDLSQHPLFQVAIALQNTPIDTLVLPDLALSQFKFEQGTSRLDLELHLWQTPEGLQGQVTYSTDLFDRSTIARTIGHFQTLLTAIAENPDRAIATLPILSPAEWQQLVAWNQTEQPYPQSCIHQLFEAQAALTPDAIAVVDATEQLTYRELNHRSNQLAHYLQQLGVVPDDLVGLCMERSTWMLVGLLGVLKAGGAYVPLDPTYPIERLQWIVEDAQLAIVLTHSSAIAAEKLECLKVIVNLDREWSAIAELSSENPVTNVSLDHLAYVIYTSGSTGQPKGVLVEHRGLANLAHAQQQIFDLKPIDRVLQFASLSFDASIFEIVMALTTGATLHVVPESARLGNSLIEYLEQSAITHATLPPAVLKTLPAAELPTLQTLIVAGEACTTEMVQQWGMHRRFFNAYGLTETTVWSTVAELKMSDRPTLIGHPIANTQLYVLDTNLQPVPIGIPGELYISGAGVTRGYLNRPALTKERFIHYKMGSDSVRLYRTGDWVRYQPNGELEFLGRVDRQVKIRGYRIELEEVEHGLCQHPDICQAVVVPQETTGHARLIAYVVPQPNAPVSSPELRNFLKQKLPAYLIPAEIIVRSSLPLTVSGKIDRNALSETVSHAQSYTFVTARTPTEATLATLWQSILNLEQVSVQDNFFELGGDSLLAAKLVDQINQKFDQKLPLSELFLAPTIEQLAQVLQSHQEDIRSVGQSWSPLVALQPRGSRLPFFCVHPIFGVVLPYCELAYQLGTEQAFYGLQPVGLDGKTPPDTQIEQMAAHYITALRAVQPHGPYQLGGWSFGGLVAFEMAQQLDRAGVSVSLLALLDTMAPIPANRLSVWDGLKFLGTTVAKSILPFCLDYGALLLNPKLAHTAWKQATIAQFLPQAARSRVLDELTVDRMFKIFYANSQAALSYKPQAYAGSIALFRTADSIKQSKDATLGWAELAIGGVDVHTIPGNHLTMLKSPQVQVLAEQLQQYLIT